MRRREFLGALGGAAMAWPLTARAQQPAMPVIGFLSGQSPDAFARYADAFRQGLKAAGYVDGENAAIEYRWARGQNDRLPAMAADLVRRQVSVIAATGGVASGLAAKVATSTIPIVAISGDDPIESGLVLNLNRPGGNTTVVSFFSTQTVAKRLALLRDLVPAVISFAFLTNPNSPESRTQLTNVQAAAASIDRRLISFNASSPDEIDAAFGAIVNQKIGGLVLAADPSFNNRRDQIIALAARHAIPTIYSGRDFVAAGGLIGYGNNLADAYRRIGIYVGRVLKGDKPGDLPVDQATKFELAINLKTAKALGLEFPLSILISVDEVIE
jgi:putative ABC transport system substrate-binding protein